VSRFEVATGSLLGHSGLCFVPEQQEVDAGGQPFYYAVYPVVVVEVFDQECVEGVEQPRDGARGVEARAADVGGEVGRATPRRAPRRQRRIIHHHGPWISHANVTQLYPCRPRTSDMHIVTYDEHEHEGEHAEIDSDVDRQQALLDPRGVGDVEGETPRRT
jgi:hypothetical protein